MLQYDTRMKEEFQLCQIILNDRVERLTSPSLMLFGLWSCSALSPQCPQAPGSASESEVDRTGSSEGDENISTLRGGNFQRLHSISRYQRQATWVQITSTLATMQLQTTQATDPSLCTRPVQHTPSALRRQSTPVQRSPPLQTGLR